MQDGSTERGKLLRWSFLPKVMPKYRVRRTGTLSQLGSSVLVRSLCKIPLENARDTIELLFATVASTWAQIRRGSTT